jgi:AcrR family transcriptional regulator
MVTRRASAPLPSSPSQPSPDSYHHGALHAALIDAAEALLQEAGIEAFSLRECARRAGVSHAAPAHHFGDARGLLSACAAAGFDRLADAMAERSTTAGPDPLARLRGIGGAYVDFALRHRALFQLMFRRDRLDPAHPALQAAGRRTGNALREAIADLSALQGLPQAEHGARILLAWSVVHGYATLVLEDQCADLFGLSAAEPAAAARMGDELLQLLQGGIAQARVPPLMPSVMPPRPEPPRMTTRRAPRR